MKTRSIRYGGPGEIELIELEVSDPGPGEVQVQGLACGICAWDIYVFKHGSAWGSMPGHEGLGRVVKVGPGITHIREGARVTGHGLGFTGLSNVNAWGLHPIPDANPKPDEHWIVEPVSCVVTGIDHCNLRAGDRVAVVGCGFMGLMILQALGRSLAQQVIAIDIDPRRLELAKKFGATHVFNSAEPGFEQRIDELKALSIDCVVDCTGHQTGLDLSSRIVRRGGRINLFGWNHGTASFPGDIWHMEGITVVNSAPNSALRDPFPPAIRLIESGIIDLGPLVTHVVSLDEYPALLAKAATKQENYIKGVVKLN